LSSSGPLSRANHGIRSSSIDYPPPLHLRQGLGLGHKPRGSNSPFSSTFSFVPSLRSCCSPSFHSPSLFLILFHLLLTLIITIDFRPFAPETNDRSEGWTSLFFFLHSFLGQLHYFTFLFLHFLDRFFMLRLLHFLLIITIHIILSLTEMSHREGRAFSLLLFCLIFHSLTHSGTEIDVSSGANKDGISWLLFHFLLCFLTRSGVEIDDRIRCGENC
ncbi:hypothetical protein PENTCL1PPCAC_7831, partial [Pristionchus entomophagus]